MRAPKVVVSAKIRRPGTIFLHLHRGSVDVERAAGQGLLQEKAVDLRIHIVEIHFDHGNFFTTASDSFFERLADHNADDIGLTFEIGGARAVPNRLDAHGRLRTKGIAKGRHNGCAGGGGQFTLHPV